MSLEFIESSLLSDLTKAKNILGYEILNDWFEQSELMLLRLSQLKSDPTLMPWLLRAVVDKDSCKMIGHFNGHTGPNPDYLKPFTKLRALEIGFTIYPQFRRKGFAKEAIEGFAKWLKDSGQVDVVVLSILTTNEASLRLARRLNFSQVGEVKDGINTELVFIRDL